MFGGEGGIRTHGGLAPTAVFKTAALNHSATSPIGASISFGEPSCARRAMNQAGRGGVLPLSLGSDEDRRVAGVSSWIVIGLSAMSLGSVSAPMPQPKPVQIAQTYGPVTTAPYGQQAYPQ